MTEKIIISVIIEFRNYRKKLQKTKEIFLAIYSIRLFILVQICLF